LTYLSRYFAFISSELSVNLSSILFTMEGVKYITKIENLTKLGVKVIRERSVDFREVIVQLAGQCPALKNLHLEHVKGHLWFVPLLGRDFPDKKLTFFDLDVKHSFIFDFPKNMLVENLKISGNLDDETILKVKCILN